MLQRTTKLIVCLWLPCATLPPAGEKSNIPDWVHQALNRNLPEYPADTDAVVLTDEVAYSVKAPGDYIEHRRRAVRLLRPGGRREGHLSIHVAGRDKVTFLRAWSLDGRGHEFVVQEREFFQVAAVIESLYDDVRRWEAEAPAAEPGAVIAFEYRIQRHGFTDELDWMPQEEIPVRFSSLMLQLPPGYEVQTVWSGISPVEPKKLDGNSLLWTLTDLPPIDVHEEKMPAPAALEAWLKVTYFGDSSPPITGDWHSLGRWYGALTAGRRAATPEIAAKVRELLAGKPDFDSRMRAVAEFIQNEIRYVAIEIGIGGYQPHAAGDVFRARYGDCKDKVTLMSTMLHEAGIDSDYMMIHTIRGAARQDVPSLRFNHVILAILLPSDVDAASYRTVITAKSGQKFLLFDPTDESTPAGEISPDLQDSCALLVAANGGTIIRTPVPDPESNRLVRRGSFTLSPGGAISGNVVETRHGAYASIRRASLKAQNEKERIQAVEHFVADSLNAASVRNLQFESLTDRNKDLIASYGISADRYAQLSGSLMLIRPRVLGQVAMGLERKKRKYPIEMGAVARIEDEYEIAIPAGFAVEDIPEPAAIDSSFSSYHSECRANGLKITYKRTFINKALEIPPDKISEFRAFQNRIGEDENAVVVLRKVR